MKRSWYVGCLPAGLVICVTAACAGRSPVRDVGPHDTGRVTAHEVSDDTTRGMEVEGAPFGSPPSTPFVLEATLHARRLENNVSIARGELRDGDTVMSGDRMQLSVRTSEDAYLYLAFCSRHAVDPMFQGLIVFPPQGNIQVKANESTIVPDKVAEIVVDNKPGQEALYLIFSRVELSRADPRLAEAVTAARQAGKAADCGEHFRNAIAGPPTPRKPGPRPPQRDGGSSAGSGARSAPGDMPMPPVRTAEGGKPTVDIERGGDIGWNGGFGVTGDTTGIAILRYGLTHVAAK